MTDSQDIKDRIKILIDITCDGKERKFAKKTNNVPQTINSMFDRPGPPSGKILENILKAYSQLNANWLMMGKEPMWMGEAETGRITISQIGSGDANQRWKGNVAGGDMGSFAALEEKVLLLEKLLEERAQVIKEKERMIQVLLEGRK